MIDKHIPFTMRELQVNELPAFVQTMVAQYQARHVKKVRILIEEV